MAENVHTSDGEGFAWYVRTTDLENPKPLSELKYVDESSYKFLKKTELHGGELLMAKRGDIGKVYIFEPRTSYATVAPNMYLLKLNNLIFPHFLYYHFISNEGNKKLTRLNSSSTLGALYKDDVKNIKVKIPSIEEQTKIGNYFKVLDTLITLHQRECFSFDFSGESAKTAQKTISWEQRKLNEIVKSIDTGKSKFHSDTNNGEYAILGSTSIIGYDDCYDYDGDFILTARVGANAGSLYRYTGKAKISDNTVFIQAEKNIDFVYYMLTKFDIKQLSFGTGQPLVKASELKNLDLKMPTQIVEQQKIGLFFSHLDILITLHQHKPNKKGHDVLSVMPFKGNQRKPHYLCT